MVYGGQYLIQSFAEVHVRFRQVCAGQREHDLLVVRKAELCTDVLFVVVTAKIRARRNARNQHVALGHEARSQRLRHGFGVDAEQVGLAMRPEPFGFVVGRDAQDREVKPCDHPRAHGAVRCHDVRADDGERFRAGNMLGEAWEHHARNARAAAPQKASREREAPGKVIDGTGDAREHGSGLVAVEADAAEIQNVQDLDVRSRGHVDAEIAGSVRVIAQLFDRLRDCDGSAFVARPNGGVHDKHARCERAF